MKTLYFLVKDNPIISLISFFVALILYSALAKDDSKIITELMVLVIIFIGFVIVIIKNKKEVV